MSDATNSNKRDLWLYDDGSWREGFHDDGKVSPLLHYIARPVADDEAREERLKRAEEQRDALAQECSETEHVAREAGADESIMPFPVALHDLLTRLTDERDSWKARAERAERAAKGCGRG